jgi:hypothetical protein
MVKHPDLDPTKQKDSILHPLAEAYVAAKEAKTAADTEFNDSRDELAAAMLNADRMEYYCDGVLIEGYEVFLIKGKKAKDPKNEE